MIELLANVVFCGACYYVLFVMALDLLGTLGLRRGQVEDHRALLILAVDDPGERHDYAFKQFLAVKCITSPWEFLLHPYRVYSLERQRAVWEALMKWAWDEYGAGA